MPLTEHQRKHLNAVIRDAEGLSGPEKARVLKTANDILRGQQDWPSHLRSPYEIHEWVEGQEVEE